MSFAHFLLLLCLVVSCPSLLHSSFIDENNDMNHPSIVTSQPLLQNAHNITYRWRQKFDFSQPTVLNIWIRFHVLQPSQSEYLVVSTTRLSWQNRNYLLLEKDGRAPALDWTYFSNAFNDPMCHNTETRLLFQKLRMDVGFERDPASQAPSGMDVQCGNIRELVTVNTSFHSEKSHKMENFLYTSQPSVPKYWSTSFGDLKGTFFYEDEFVNGLSDRGDVVMDRIKEDDQLSSEFRKRVRLNSRNTTFSYDSVMKFRNLDQVYLPFGVSLHWNGYSSKLEKPLSAHSAWSVSSILDVPLRQVMENPEKYSRDRTFAPGAIAVDVPLTSEPDLLQCSPQYDEDATLSKNDAVHTSENVGLCGIPPSRD